MVAVKTLLWQSVLIIAISLLLAASIELFLRLVYTARADSFPIRFHSRYIHILNPNTTYEFQRSTVNGGQTIKTRINQWSFNGGPIDPESKATRIMVYGDSNVHAAFSEEHNAFARQLKSALETTTTNRFQVINAGVVGYGIDQVLLRLEDEVPIWRPDVVIVNIFADNDFGDTVRNRLFYLDEDTGDLKYRGVPFSETAGNFAASLYTVRASIRLWQELTVTEDEKRPHRPYVPPPPDVELVQLRQHIVDERLAYRDLTRSRAGSDHYDLDVALDPDEPNSRIKIDLMEKLLARIIRVVADQHKIRLVFVIQPSVKDISTNSALNYQQLRTLSEHYRRDRLTGLLAEILDRHDADYVNLFKTFVTDGPSPYYFLADDNHWNDRGQARAAQIVAQHLLNTSGSTGEVPPEQSVQARQ
jgi:hypothetical protein